MDPYFVNPCAAEGTTLPAQPQSGVVAVSTCGKLAAGTAVTLRAKQLSVLRISHGQVWVTLSDAGPYGCVVGGDHFLSRGQSLTLLPGQEVVMEPFKPSGSSHLEPQSATHLDTHAATAHFTWDPPGVATGARQEATTAHEVIGSGVRQPLRDLRHALGLVAGACSRLVQGLAHGAATTTLKALNIFAIFLVARRERIACPDSPFEMQKSRL